MKKRRRFNPEFKARVALEALQEQQSVNELASRFQLHPNQVTQWKRQARAGLVQVFSDGVSSTSKEEAQLRDRLFQQIGQLQFELEWLKKKTGCQSC